MIFIVGGKGLTGSALVEYAKKNGFEFEIIQRENKEEFFGKSCDVLIFANGNAVKSKANQDPFFDFHASVSSVVEYVQKIDYKKFVLLSTVDVYDRKDDERFTNEDIKINEKSLAPYGFHKLLAENYVKRYCSDYLIFRLGGLVGNGLKKNPAYYFIKKDSKVTISPDSELNFIHTDLVAEIIFKALHDKISNEIFNVASKNSIRIGDIRNIIKYDSEFSDDAKNQVERYKINTHKIQKLVKTSTSEDSIKKYFDELEYNI